MLFSLSQKKKSDVRIVFKLLKFLNWKYNQPIFRIYYLNELLTLIVDTMTFECI